MSLRIGGYAAILGSLLFLVGFLANTLDGSDDAWPTSGIILAGLVVLLVGMAGLSAFQARRHPMLVWTAFLVPFVGGVLMVAGLAAMGIAGDADVGLGISGWGLGMLGLATLIAGSALFALASWRAGTPTHAGTALLGVAGLLVVPVAIGVLGAWPWEPITALLGFSMLMTFAVGWLVTGLIAVRADRLTPAIHGGAV